MRTLYVLGCLSIVLLFSCKTQTIRCYPAAAQVNFVGYNFDEINNAKVYVYKKDNLFDSLIDSTNLDAQQSSTDTINTENGLQPDFDYQIKVLSSDTVYIVTNLTLGNHYTEKITTGLMDAVKYGCINKVTSCTLNGQPVVLANSFIYLNK